MANRITLEAGRRTAMTKGERNRIRAVGDIPGIVYGKEQAPTPIYIKGESFKQLRNHGKILVDVQIDGTGTISAMINEVERDMINRRPVHIDLHAVNLREPISVDVQLILDGLEAVEKRGAVIQQQMREVTVRCLPTDVPEYILHNIGTLEIGENSTCADLKLPPNVELQHHADEVIASAIEAKNPEPETEIEPKEPELVHDTEGKGEEANV
jgi:large subunit ribosomal protein L25